MIMGIKFMFRNSKSLLFAISLTLSVNTFAQSSRGNLDAMTGLMNGWMQGSAQRQQYEAEQERQNQIARANTDPRLLPLVPNGSISPETQQLIFSNLNKLLEFYPNERFRSFENRNAGSHGDITVYDAGRNSRGNECRNFTISLTNSNNKRNYINGTACQEGYGWRWL
jgi:hypothetical protein